MGWLQHPAPLHMAPTQPLHINTAMRQASSEDMVPTQPLHATFVVRQESTENVVLNSMWWRQSETNALKGQSCGSLQIMSQVHIKQACLALVARFM